MKTLNDVLEFIAKAIIWVVTGGFIVVAVLEYIPLYVARGSAWLWLWTTVGFLWLLSWVYLGGKEFIHMVRTNNAERNK